MRLYREAAEAGNATGMYYLGLSYREGLGVKQSGADARRWFQKAADLGHEAAKKELAKLR